jgi:DNA-3-methyladenine glycosylase I
MNDAGIVRHRGKIVSAINNAARTLDLQAEFGSLAAYAWSWEPPRAERPVAVTWDVLKAAPTTAASTALSKDLKRRGWTFVGPTTIYAFMQAMGLVNDHLEGCFVRRAVSRERRALAPPRHVTAVRR